MTIDEIINKLTLEMFLIDEDADNFSSHRTIIQRAVVYGMEHPLKEVEGIVMLDEFGKVKGKFKNLFDASKKLNINPGSISKIIRGIRHSAGGFLFVKSKIWIN